MPSNVAIGRLAKLLSEHGEHSSANKVAAYNEYLYSGEEPFWMSEAIKPEGRYVSFRVSGKDERVLRALMELWEENQSQTIKRALQIAYDIECQLNEATQPEGTKEGEG